MSIIKAMTFAAAALVLFATSAPSQAASNHQDYTYEKVGKSAGDFYRDPTTREALDSGTWYRQPSIGSVEVNMIAIRRSSLGRSSATTIRNVRLYQAYGEVGHSSWPASLEGHRDSRHRRLGKNGGFLRSVVLLLLVLFLIGISAGAYLRHSNSIHEAAKGPGLEASVVETLEHLDDHHMRNVEPRVPFDRGVPDFAVR